MKSDKTAQLIDYLEGTLGKEEAVVLELELANSPALRLELKKLEKLLQTMNAVQMQQPSAQLQHNFNALLETKKRTIAKSVTTKTARIFKFPTIEWSVAAAIALLAIGLGFGTLWQKNRLQQQQINALAAEVKNTNKMLILNLLREESASQRIKAVNTAVEAEVAHPQVIRALIHTLHADENVNVRMKAAEGLAQFARQPEVIDALTEALKMEKSPEVQITLIDILINLKAYEAKDEFKKLLQQKDVMEVVKNKAAYGVEVLM